MFMFEITYCQNCGKDLNTLLSTKKYCNDSCRHKHKRRLENPEIGPVGRPRKEKDPLLKWIHNGKHMTYIPNDKYYGFVYLVTQISTGREYVGKKAFWSEKEGEIKESNWLNYATSSKELQMTIKENPDDFKTKVIEFAYTEKQLAYFEYKWQDYYAVFHTGGFNKKCYKKFKKKK